MHFWTRLYDESQIQGKWLMGRLLISDVEGLSWARFMRARPALKKLSVLMTDHFPEGARIIFVVNVSRIFYGIWLIFKQFLPASTVLKVRLYKKGDSRFIRDIAEYIDIDQIPPHLGGTCPIPWPYGDGGDVPVGCLPESEVFNPLVKGPPEGARRSSSSASSAAKAPVAQALVAPPSPSDGIEVAV